MTTMQLESVLANPFVQHYADCVENLPNSLQALLTELRNVDAKVTEFHRKLAKMKENLNSEQPSVEQLSMLHKLLLKCQELGDQKVELVTQVVNLIDAKAKQLVLDKKTIENKSFEPDFDEEKIVADFKAAIKARPVLLTHNKDKHNGTGFNLVTKAMSKYIASNYDDNKSQFTRLKEKEREKEKDLRHRCLMNNFAASRDKEAAYQLPERRVKKPRLDNSHIKSSISTAYHLSPKVNKLSENTPLSRSKRQLPFTSSPKTLLSSSAKKKQSLHSQRSLSHHSHHSSPSSASSSSHSSSHSNRAKLNTSKHAKNRQSLASNENRAPNDTEPTARTVDEGHKIGENCAASVISTISSSCASIASSSSASASCSASSNSNVNGSQSNNGTGDIAEETYCTCRQVSYGSMIACDNDNCKYQWFHFDCVKITTKPKGKWYCPLCRGDSHKVMRKVMH